MFLDRQYTVCGCVHLNSKMSAKKVQTQLKKTHKHKTNGLDNMLIHFWYIFR